MISGLRWLNRAQAEADMFGMAEIRCSTCRGQLPATFFGVGSLGQRDPRCHTCRSDDNAKRRMQLIAQARLAPGTCLCKACLLTQLPSKRTAYSWLSVPCAAETACLFHDWQ